MLLTFTVPYEPFCLFFAALCLHVFSSSAACLIRPDTPDHIALDEEQPNDRSVWIDCGGPSTLAGIGDLGSALAPKRVLVFFSQALSQHVAGVWHIGILVGKVLADMGAREESE